MPKKKKKPDGSIYNDAGELIGEGLDNLVGLFDEDANEEAARSTVPSDSSLAQIADLARRQIDLEDQVEKAETDLKETKKKLRIVAEVEIPEAFAELGISELSLDSGEKIKVEQKTKASIPTGDKPESVAKREAAFAWLRENGADALIKADLKTVFGRGKDQRELQEKAIEKLIELGVAVDVKESVSWNTLTAFVKERIEAGLPVDVELLGIIELSKTKIVRPEKQ